MKLQNWINLNRLNAQISSNICSIEDKSFLILERDEDELLFNSDFSFNLTSTEQKILSKEAIQEVLFNFGHSWYFSSIENIKFNIFKYIGKEVSEFVDIEFPYLGIHGEYDLCNGSRPYDEWIRKAKFLNSPSLGICETNTLAGTLSFQLACEKYKIKSILGETVTVSLDNEGKQTYKVKLYVKNEIGWVNLLNINSQIKVFNDNFVTEEYLLNRSEGLICVLSIDILEYTFTKVQSVFKEDLYCQLDFVEWASADKDLSYLENLKTYFTKHIDVIKPALICDSFYLDKEQAHIKKTLNSIGKIGFQNQSNDQYFKSIKDIYFQVEELSADEEWPLDIIMKGIEGAIDISDKCNFQIKLGELHLPQYEMTKEESDQFNTNEDLFYHLIAEGLDRIRNEFVVEEEEYLKRVEREADLISRGGFIDYFLITWDILNWCRKNDILCPVGRGSAAGSLVSYLLNITQLDPLKYNLLFERFLSEARILSSMPDIDNDLPSDRRDDVKRYMENRYGLDYVTSIGTYGTLKIKSAIKDLCRAANIDGKMVNYITGMIKDDNISFTELFELALKEPQLKTFIQNHYKVIEDFPLIANQVKNSSIHAAGVIIVPKTYQGKPMTIYDWLPVKKIDGVLVTEWEGPQVEKAGYLKTDILGVKQLQKLAEMIKLIITNHKAKIEFKNIPLADNDVYDLFRAGYNEDVFQLGAAGLQNYCRKLKPDGIEDLIATLALYRPGPMESGAHEDYIKIKNGEKLPEYDYMLEEVTKNTHSKYIYQEQIMQAVQILGGFTLAEAEEVRSAMGKKIFDKMEKYKAQFIEGAIVNGCDRHEALMIWNKLEVFAGYAFNKAHSASYAHVGYYCQWLKFHYPLEFWSVTLNNADQKDIARYIAEMHTISEVKVLPPDINQSSNNFEADKETNEIFWSIGSIKYVGEKTLEAIMLERVNKGKFFSFDDFYSRIKKSEVDSRCVTNLILSGCFDKVEKIKKSSQRLILVKKFLCDLLRRELPEDLSDVENNWKDYYWTLKQKELTGFGYLEFEKIYKSNAHLVKNIRYLNPLLLEEQKEDNVTYFTVVGVLIEIIVRTSVKGPWAIATVNSNDQNIMCSLWSERWDEWKDVMLNNKNKIILLTGIVKHPNRYQGYHIQTTDKTMIEFL